MKFVSMLNSIMSVPFGDFGCVRTPLSAAWGARHFSARRHSNRRALPCDRLPVTLAACGQVRGNFGAGAVGGFFIHASTVLFFAHLSHTTVHN